jgi:hypothetical protein
MAITTATLALGLVACDTGDKKSKKDKDEAEEEADEDEGKSKKKSKKSKKSDDEDEDDTASATEKASADAACGPPSEIPDIPDSRSNPPSLEEWGTGCDVNTQGAGKAADCTMKVKREWLQITCRGNMTGYEQFDGFGTLGQDYFEQHRAGQMASFVVRLRKDRSLKVRFCRGNERASLFVSWPPGRTKPSIIALAAGTACDGSSWGAHP